MSTTHTPGPWVTDDYEYLWRDSDGGPTAHFEAGPAQVYFMPRDTADRQRALNDARLIAAAPELLKALEGCIEWLEALREADEFIVIENAPAGISLLAARAAIAKAKGTK